MLLAGSLLALAPPSLAASAPTTEQTPEAAAVEPLETSPVEAPDPTPPQAKPESTERAPQPEPAKPAPTPKEPVEPATEPSAGIDASQWARRTDELIEAIRTGAAEPVDADALYLELEAVIWPYQRDAYRALRQNSPDALARREVLDQLYDTRIRLLAEVTPSFLELHLGGGTTGMRELGHELSYARLNLFFQTLAIPRGLHEIVTDVLGSPLDNLWQILQLCFAILVFRGWRRWAKSGLANARRSVLAIRPRRATQLSTAKFLWYLDRVRNPLEWLGLLVFISSLFEPGDLEEIGTLVGVTLLWLLMARFAVVLIDAWAARGASGLSEEDSALRLRSLRLVAAWLLLLGLGLDLAARYAGEGAIYTWVWRSFLLLALPVLIQLVRWWRSRIFDGLREESSYSAWARRLIKREHGIAGHVNALLGAGYLVSIRALQGTVHRMSKFEVGRRAIALLLRREVERDLYRKAGEDEGPVSPEIVAALLDPGETFVDGIARKEFEQIIELIEAGRGGVAGILAEHGAGLSTFLRRVTTSVGDSMRIIDCPLGGFEQFRDALAAELELEPGEDLRETIGPRLASLGVRVLAIDNFHRMVRPCLGGLEAVDRLAALAETMGEDVLWLLGIDRNAWPYVSRARGDRAALHLNVELPPWSDTQLGLLIDARSRALGIEPDHRRLVFPRQFDESEHTTLEERNRKSFRRILWDLSGGNPAVAMRLYADSLRSLPKGKLTVRLPQPPSPTILTERNLTTLLTLRVIVQCELATLEDIVASLRIEKGTIMAILRFCLQQGWIERVDDTYQISWSWFRTITRVLVRQNLLHH